MPFRTLLSPQSRARLDAVRSEMARLHALPDRWLGQEILRLARQARQLHPKELGDPRDIVYGPTLVWHVAPEVARRLGATQLQPNESTIPEYRAAPPEELRRIIGQFIAHSALDRLDYVQQRGTDATRPGPGQILCHLACNGNPLAMAADRIASPPPPGMDSDDPIASMLRTISARRGHPETASWHPALQEDPAPDLHPQPIGIRSPGMA